MEALKHKFGDNAARLEVLSPLKTLARGYAIATRMDNGRVITDANELFAGERLLLTLRSGTAHCRVE
jgi:exodeoxyribonuclease VII large subunit